LKNREHPLLDPANALLRQNESLIKHVD
jgi:hypothetical protein